MDASLRWHDGVVVVKAVKRILILLIALAIIALALANTHPITLQAPLYREYTLELPVYLFFFLTLLLGVLLSALVGISRRCRQIAEKRDSRRAIKKLEHEVDLLKVESRVKAQAEEA